MYGLIKNSIDLHEYLNVLKELFEYPFHIVARRAKRGDVKWNELNAFFHVGIVRLYSSLSGLLENEAKEELQTMFALVEEHNDYYMVESVSGMSKERLVLFIQNCQVHMIKNFGTKANENEYVKPKVKKIVKRKLNT